jgi:phosphopantetheinyl transferase
MAVLSEDELVGFYRIPEGPQFSKSSGFTNEDMVTSPLQTELGYQVAGAYTLDRFDMMALPVSVGKIEYSSIMGTDEPAIGWIRFKGREENTFSFDVDIIDLSGNIRFSYTDFKLKGLMANKVDLKGDHSFNFEEEISPLKGIRIFKMDIESMEDVEMLKGGFTDDEWESLFTEKMTDKRKVEHGSGRLISKLGVSWYLSTVNGISTSLKDIKIETEEDGKPFAIYNGERVEISISHSHRWAISSVGKRVHGIDIELTEPRDLSFAEEAFASSEIDLLKKVQEGMDISESMAQTLLFSAKESYQKMIGKGMKVDLKEIIASEMIQVPAKTGLGFEVLLENNGEENKVEAMVASAYVLTVCSK